MKHNMYVHTYPNQNKSVLTAYIVIAYRHSREQLRLIRTLCSLLGILIDHKTAKVVPWDQLPNAHNLLPEAKQPRKDLAYCVSIEDPEHVQKLWELVTVGQRPASAKDLGCPTVRSSVWLPLKPHVELYNDLVAREVPILPKLDLDWNKLDGYVIFSDKIRWSTMKFRWNDMFER